MQLGAERVALSPREHELLGLLLRRQGQTVARRELAALFDSSVASSNAVNVHINNLRKKLGSAHVVIVSVRSIGYRLRAATADDVGDPSSEE